MITVHMKQHIPLLAFVLLCIPGPAISQKHFSFGIAGTGLTTVITNQNNYGLPFEMSYRPAFSGSCNVNTGFDLSDRYGLRTGIGFARLGQNYKDTYNDTAYTRNIRLDYLQIPVLFKYTATVKFSNFYAMGGLQFGLLLAATQRYLKNGATYDEPVPGEWPKPELIGEQTITDRYNSLDIMIRADLGAEMNIAENLLLNAAVTLAYGLKDINAPDWKISDHTGQYHASHNIYAGITFGINYLLPVGSGK